MAEATVSDRIDAARRRIAAAAEHAGRDPGGVRLIAVTKGVGADAIQEAVAAGIADIGENRVQEAMSKRDHLPAGLRWHLIGHLQRNKARSAADLFDAVHSIDSFPVAAALARHRPPPSAPLTGFVEIDLTGIDARTGAAEADAEALVRACLDLRGIALVGLMTIAPPGETDVARACFRRLRLLRDRLRSDTGAGLAELSMGMSDDFEVAIEEGATVVRLGRVLFGERRRPAGSDSMTISD